jgi:tRNA threonylcarbamoyladenosine biosynthesis protein TsaE
VTIVVLPFPCERATLLDVTSAKQTRALGERLGRAATPGDLILLTGPLGSGKTALTQGIAAGLDCPDVINSPTFTLLKEHLSGRIPLYHFDLYRLDDPDEIWALGFEDYFSGAGLSVVEWAERAPDVWPDDWLWLALSVTGATARRIACCAQGERGQALLARCAVR